ncbi:SET and MYND domain-containing protein 4 [Podila humilis]|nr:SET and MYND domain-containing protein 4 [Podila humilis]
MTTNATKHKTKSSLEWIEEPIAAAYNKDLLPVLLAVSDANTDLATIQKAFTGMSLSNTNAHGEMVAKFDKRFQIGFSRLYGHAVELANDGDGEKDTTTTIPSGTYVFESSEMPYACIVQEPWRGSVCEECLRLLPKDPRQAFVCPGCTDPMPDQRSEQQPTQGIQTSQTISSLTSDSAVFVKAPYQPARFCSRECMRVAWKSWHGYECGYMGILQEMSTNKRLALRAYWKNSQLKVKIAASTTTATTTATASEGSNRSHPVLRQEPGQCATGTSKQSASLSLSNAQSLSDTKPGGLAFDNVRRVHNTDGSDIRISQLCHNFSKLERSQRNAYLMVGYYFQRAMDLADDAATEIAYLLAITTFNAFAVKSHSHGTDEDSDTMRHMNESTIGMALYLKASMFNHSCAPNSLAVFGCTDPRTYPENADFSGKKSGPQGTGSTSFDRRRDGPDPRSINILTTKSLTVDKDVPVLVEISYGPQVGRMPTHQRKLYLENNHHFKCNCTACNDRFAETVHRRVFKCPKNGYACRSLAEDEKTCPTCGAEVDFSVRYKLHNLMVRLVSDSEDKSLTPAKRLKILLTLESSQSKVFVNTHILYGHTCDRLAQAYAEAGDLAKSIEWCTKAHKVILVHFPHDSIEVAQETLKLAGLLFNNSQPKEAMRHVKNAIGLYKGHYGAASTHPDLVELYEMEKVLEPIIEGFQ